MKLEKFDEALKCYTDAIKLDGKNAVYYCNRAAAYSKLNNHSFALEDCRRAIEIDESYSKAYGRMGLAYASLNDHFRARECYKKAAELDPQNESYKNNLSIAEEKVSELEVRNKMRSVWSVRNCKSLNFSVKIHLAEWAAAVALETSILVLFWETPR